MKNAMRLDAVYSKPMTTTTTITLDDELEWGKTQKGRDGKPSAGYHNCE
jgi:hypothetical protein